MDLLLDGLEKKLTQSGIAFDVPKIITAYEFACAAHEGQLRRSGDLYVTHPVAVAEILVDLGLDTDSIIGGLLHDVVEDTPVDLPMIEKLFGGDVALLVDGVTKLGHIPYTSREEQQAENIRKMLLAMAKDIRVILIKLADRLHNMRTIDAMPPKKQLEKSFETMEVFAPIAHRLGIRTIKDELEDISLRHLDSVAYSEIEAALANGKEERVELLEHIKERITERLSGLNMNVHIGGRVKSVYGMYRKMYLHGKSFDEIYDIYAVRVIVDTVNDCYNVLGIIHDMMKPIPGRFKDYISTPKPNMYQSLHTTVIGKEGIPFEVQIRTWEMQYTAEYGIAAHWKYKLGISANSSGSLDQRLTWVRRLLEMQQEFKDADDLMRSLKTDLAPDEVFVFTPRGAVIDLPLGATPIDFAFAIHSAVGNRMIGAKVDGKIVPIDYQLQTGEIVEILTSSPPGHGPSRDWLKIVRTSEARNKIRAWFKRERRDENIAEGRSELEKEFRRNGIILSETQYPDFVMGVAKRQHFNTTEEFLASIGYGGIVLSKIIPRIKDDYLKTMKPQSIQIPENITQRHTIGGVIVEGIDNCLVKMARCCNPVPGDKITGFITRGFGVSIHKLDCPNVAQNINLEENAGRWVNVSWAQNVSKAFKASLQIVSADRYGLLADVSAALASMHVMIHSVNARELKNGNAAINLTVDVTSIEHLQNVISRLNKISSVLEVSRSGQS
jgi:GTP pyrophosphokinase